MKKNLEKFVAIDIGTYGLRLAEVRVDDDCVNIIKYSSVDYNQLFKDNAPFAIKVLNALEIALINSGTKEKKAVISLPGNNMFESFTSLPPLDERDKDRKKLIIDFEAKQNIPFSMEEIYWRADTFCDSQSYNHLENCALISVNKEKYIEIICAVEEAGLKPFLVTSANYALLNGFIACNPPPKSQDNVLINVGHQITSIILTSQINDVDGLKYAYYFRSCPIAGSSITSQISKELGIAEEEAEKLKREHVHREWKNQEDESEIVYTAQKLARNVISRIKGEVNRSISVYRAQLNKNKPSNMIITGRGFPESAEDAIKLEYVTNMKLSFPSTLDYVINPNIKDFSSILPIIGLAEMASNSDAIFVDFCEKKNTGGIILSLVKGVVKVISIPFKIRMKIYLKEN